MIAGTSFELLPDARQVWAHLCRRIARTKTPPQVLGEVALAAETESALSMTCSDGLVIMTLKASPDGTITALVLLAVSFGSVGAFGRQENAMMEVARDAGATRLSFRTDRKGWKRLVGPEWQFDGEFFSRSL